jgi:hypothetical protein
MAQPVDHVEAALIVQEVKDHATYWKSDKAKRLTVEKHLTQKGVMDVGQKIDALISLGVLGRVEGRSEYLRIVQDSDCKKKPCVTCDERDLFPCDGARRTGGEKHE